MIENTRLISYFINGVIILLMILITVSLVITAVSIMDKLSPNGSFTSNNIEIKVKDVVKIEDAYVIFDTNNNVYIYSKLLPEITTGKNYTMSYINTIDKFHNFYEVGIMREV